MRVLIVDDEELIIEFLKRSLKNDHHSVDIARDGLEAIQKASKKSFDVIVLDILMPHRNGIEVCRELRNTGITTPILILSSSDSESARIEGLDAGADDYLIKPFSYLELIARLRALHRRPIGTFTPKLKHGKIELDPVSHIVTLSGQNIDIRPKEYDLLQYLMLHEGTAVKRYELLTNVWGVSATNTSNRLDVCIRQLRKKIDDTEQKQNKSVIKTVHSYGYKIDKY